jgi:hypothetical protein
VTPLADWLARRLWWACLQFMRRPWMWRLRRGWVRWLPEPRREKAWADFRRQERLARRIGLPFLRGLMVLSLYGVALSISLSLASWALDQGWLPSRPDDWREGEGPAGR